MLAGSLCGFRLFSLPYFILIFISEFLMDRSVYRMSLRKSAAAAISCTCLFIAAWVLCILFNPDCFAWNTTYFSDWSQSLVQLLLMVLVLKVFAGILFHIISNRIPVYSDPKAVLIILYAGFLSILIPVLVGANPGINRMIILWLFPGSLLFTCLFVLLIFADRQRSLRQIEEIRSLGRMQKQYIRDLKMADRRAVDERSGLPRLIEESALLIRENRMDEARNLLKQISETNKNENSRAWSLNPVINALLNEKSAICDQKEIRLECSIMTDEKLDIDSLDLCRALGNLLDNTIRSCDRVRDMERSILLQIEQKNGYLLIHCQNPFLLSDQGKLLGTGYGHQILREIAQRYDGRFRTQSDGQNGFSARLILKMGLPDDELSWLPSKETI